MPPPTEKQVQTAYDLFLDKGLIGAVAMLAIMALIWAITRLLKSKDDRINDQALYAQALQKINEGVTKLIIEVNKSATDALAETQRSSTALSTTVKGVEKVLEGLDKEVGALRDEQVRLVSSLGGNVVGPTRGRR